MDITFIDETEKVPTEEIKEIENLPNLQRVF